MRASLRYSAAVLTTALAIVLTSVFVELLAPMRLFFLWCAVLVSALIGGTGAGLLATVLALLGALYFVFAPSGSFDSASGYDFIRIALFGLFAGGISIAVGRAKTLAERLRENERRYRTLVESTPLAQAVWTATPDGARKSAPRWLDDMHPEDATRTRERWNEAVANQSLYDDEIRIRVGDGRDRWFAIKASPVRRKGDSITEWAGIVTDIHDRKRHERDAAFINRASELLSATLGSEQTLRNLARLCVPELADWCVIDLGDGPGYQRNIVEHQDYARVQLALDLDARFRSRPDDDPVVQVLRSGRTQLVDDPSDQRIVRELALRSWIVAPMIARGRTLGALTVAHSADSGRRHASEDVSLIEELARRAAMALDNARLYEAADAANRAKDEFLATLSHELRTPLTAISGWAHMLETGISDPETSRLAVATIVRSARTQGELIDDLLDLSRVVAGTLHLQVEPVDLMRIVHEVMVAARPAADAKDVTLELMSSATPLVVRGDQRRLRQIVWNLVTNAVKFTDTGGSVQVNVSGAGALARIEVTDTGRGIEASFLPYVWDRFRQADSSTSRQHGGLGLGLAVVRHLVEMHGGMVHAESEGLGRGSTFRVEIPLARPSDARVELARDLSDDVSRMRGLRVLLVEDDDDARAMMTTMLAQFGADVSPAASVSEAMWLLEAQPFDVAVSDIAMPDEDGYAFVERTRSRVPAIAVSAISTGVDDRRRALDAGFADFVRKPVDPRELVTAVLGAVRV
ncbi:MAG TPA: ATP-binding protein [Thermoanaerobaculia bacterium]|nr:ATP-binding protein [Thermoanaerobaculia bacterium]